MAGGTSVNKRRREMQRKERQADKVSRRDERRVKKDGPEENGRKVSLEVFLETWDGISPLPEGWNDPVPEEEAPAEEVEPVEAPPPVEATAPANAPARPARSGKAGASAKGDAPAKAGSPAKTDSPAPTKPGV